MSASLRAEPVAPSLRGLLQNAPNLLLAPVPLALIQPILTRIVSHVARARPELFRRLGPNAGKRFLIDPTDFPFVLVLTPERDSPRLRAHRRHENPAHDAAIAGRFLDLLDLIDGSLDGDALFFSRALCVTGDTEAVVALRNALDDVDGSALDSVVAALGPLTRPASLAVAAYRHIHSGQRHDI
jgi:predicted lipid carrier protein YhbT